MLPKKERLGKADFTQLKTKVIFRGTYLDIGVSSSKVLKFACVISKKRIKKAVERNKARRRVYSIIEKTKPKNPNFVVIYPKHGIITGNYSHIQTEVKEVFATL